ncbi:MAG: elongation factor G [Planctomycetota bacterium]|nr:elongation factor G [Planctomycetota bacterium]
MSKPNKPVPEQRNIGIIAHIDAGKTTVTERMLLYSGRIRSAGEVHDGAATMDWMTDERERGITITTAATTCDWHDCSITILDTPGHVDFTAEVERSLRVLDGAIGVFDGKHGVEAQSETVWRQADRYGVPRLAFINKLDAVGADFDAAVLSVAERLACRPVPVTIPWGEESGFEGVLDVIARTGLRFHGETGSEIEVTEVPAEHRDRVDEAREKLVDVLTSLAPDEVAEPLMQKFLAGEELTPADFDAPLRAVTITGAVVPVLCGSALKNIGIQPLLDGVVRWLPAPQDLPPIEADLVAEAGGTATRLRSSEEALLGLAFKTAHDRHGDLTFLRLYSGTLERGGQFFNSRVGKPERAGRIFEMHADRREELECARAGQIVGIAGLRFTATGDTICEKSNPVRLEPPTFPQTVITQTIEPKSSAHRDKLADALAALSREDPTFVVDTDEDSGATVIQGMGELHLEVLASRLRRDFKVDIRIGQPRVGYRETATRSAEAEVVMQRQIGGRDHYAKVRVELVPDQACVDGPRVDVLASTEAIPREFRTAVHDGALAGASAGPLGSYPVIYARVRVLDGATRPGEASDVGFAQASLEAVSKAFEAARPRLLEPVMRFVVTVADEHFGAALDELNTRRAEIGAVAHHEEVRSIEGLLPLAESFGFAGDLRSISKGRGSCSLEPHSFAPVPADTARRVLGLMPE